MKAHKTIAIIILVMFFVGTVYSLSAHDLAPVIAEASTSPQNQVIHFDFSAVFPKASMLSQ